MSREYAATTSTTAQYNGGQDRTVESITERIEQPSIGSSKANFMSSNGGDKNQPLNKSKSGWAKIRGTFYIIRNNIHIRKKRLSKKDSEPGLSESKI